MFLGGMVLLMADSWGLSWVAMVRALKSRRHLRAVFGTLARIMFFPWLAIALFWFLGMSGALRGSGDVLVCYIIWFMGCIFLDSVQGSIARGDVIEILRTSPTQARCNELAMEGASSFATERLTHFCEPENRRR
jgi:hypothetical protein